MFKFLMIALGGALGTLLRYIVSGMDYKLSSGVFPFGTFIVNISGSLAVGFLWGLIDRFAVSPNLRLFIFIGLLGGYTTFSTFGLESFNLLRDGEYEIALANILLSNVLGIGCVFLGFFMSRFLINVIGFSK